MSGHFFTVGPPVGWGAFHPNTPHPPDQDLTIGSTGSTTTVMTDSKGLSRADRLMFWLEKAMCRVTRRYLLKPAPVVELGSQGENEIVDQASSKAEVA